MISGVYVPLLTAFAADGSIDLGAFSEHARWLAQAGADGLVPFGTSGEGPSLSVREKLVALEALCAADIGLPIVPAITESSLDGALDLVRASNDAPVEALLVLPPFYFMPPAQDGLARFLEQVVSASTHPVLLYHIPEFAPGVPVSLVEQLPVAGVKDSGGDIGYTKAVLGIGKRVMVGAEHTIVEAVRSGADGTIGGLANILPEHLSASVAAARQGDTARADKIIQRALEFRAELLGSIGPMEWVTALKLLAQARHGVPLGTARAPMPATAAGAAGLGERLAAVIATSREEGLIP